MLVSPEVHVPFVDRGGLLGFEILPWIPGDDERYEVFTITGDAPWIPRRFLDNSPPMDTMPLDTFAVAHETQAPGAQCPTTSLDTPMDTGDALGSPPTLLPSDTVVRLASSPV